MAPLSKRKVLYEGKAKILFEGPEEDTLIQHFKDDATAFNGEKKAIIPGKGVINNRISEHIMLQLAEIGIPTHFIRTLNMREQLIRKVDIFPIEVIVRNIAAGGISKRLGLEEGTVLPRPIIEFFYKNDALNDPLVSEDTILAFGWCDQMHLEEIRTYALRINDFLRGMFRGVGIRLIDFKLEFGRIVHNFTEQLILADEISPDNCRLWDYQTNNKLDKDRFRRDLGDVEGAYLEVARRLGVLSQLDPTEEEKEG